MPRGIYDRKKRKQKNVPVEMPENVNWSDIATTCVRLLQVGTTEEKNLAAALLANMARIADKKFHSMMNLRRVRRLGRIQ